MAEVGEAFVTIIPSARGFGRALDNTVGGEAEASGRRSGARFGRVFASTSVGPIRAIGGIAAAAFAGAAVANFFKGAVSGASDLNESVNAVNVTFGKSADGILKLGQSAATTLGLSTTEFNSLSVQFSSFATTIAGKGGDVVATMRELTGRGADFASVMNLDVNEAMGLFQSGLAGETEPLRRFGIDLSAAKVEAFAYAEGIASAGTPLTEQQKVQARYALLMKQTAKTQGDFANTSGGLANQQRILSKTFANLQASVGQLLLPVLTRLVSFANSSVIPAIAGFVTGVREGTGAGGELAAITRSVVGAFQAAMPAVSAVVGFLVDNKEAVGAFFTVLAVGVAVSKAFAAAQALVAAVMLANPFTLVVVALAALVAAFVVAYKRSETFRKIVNAVFGAVRAVAGAVLGWLADTAPRVFSVVAAVASRQFGIIRSVVSAVMAVVSTVVRVALAVVQTQFRALSAIVGVVTSIFANVVNAIRSKLDAAVDLARGLAGRILGAIGNFSTLLYSKGAELIQGLISGITSKIDDVKDAIGSVAGAVKDFLPGSPVREGPLRSWNNGAAGKRLMDLLASGITGAPVEAAMTSALSGVSPTGSPLRAIRAVRTDVTTTAAAGSRGAAVHVEHMHVRDERAVARELDWRQRQAVLMAEAFA